MLINNKFIGALFITCLSFLISFTPSVSIANEKIFIKDYSYRASDIDSKVSSRTIALEQVKRLLLEELGTYLISETEVKNYQITKDQITTFTAGIVATTIIDEKWDGHTYYLKAKITADPKEVAKSVDALKRDNETSKELAAVKKKAEDAMNELEKLRKIVGSSKSNPSQQNDYTKATNELSSKELYYVGFALLRNKNYRDAINTFSKAIELSPNSEEAYINRGLAYYNLGLSTTALNDYNQAISRNSHNPKTYVLRGLIYEIIAAANTRSYIEIVMANYDKAIQLDPLYAEAYYYKGAFISRLPGDDCAIFLRATCGELSDYNFNIAKRLGYK